MSKFTNDVHFKSFAALLQQVIAEYNDSDEDLTKKQKRQVESLVKAERTFKKVLQKDSRGQLAYLKFINYIWNCGQDNARNILQARPFFRERHGVFSKKIFKAIKNKKPKQLYEFDINYVFINFILSSFNWGPNSKITKAANEVIRIREEIIEQNMPLAISRAMIFKKKTPESHLAYMDFIQISAEGLINAVDKFVLPYSPVFRSVIIGRIVGDLINNYSEKMLHFYPSDRRKLHRAYKALKEASSFEELAILVNSGTKLENPTTASEIQNLITASSHFSLESPAPEGDEGEACTLGDIYPDNESLRPDILTEENDLRNSLYSQINNLSIYEQKLLKLKGVYQ